MVRRSQSPPVLSVGPKSLGSHPRQVRGVQYAMIRWKSGSRTGTPSCLFTCACIDTQIRSAAMRDVGQRKQETAHLINRGGRHREEERLEATPLFSFITHLLVSSGCLPNPAFQPSQAAGQLEVVQAMPGIPSPQELPHLGTEYMPHYMRAI